VTRQRPAGGRISAFIGVHRRLRKAFGWIA
jgi:hypothetical protein